MIDYARELGIGISQFVSVGNKTDVSGNDFLLQWENDPSVRLIMMYVESFGNPAKFLAIARRITRTKPIIAVKSGRSATGARAAASHTGALAASDSAVDAVIAQAGVIRAGSIAEMFDIAVAVTDHELPASRNTAVLTNAGGPGILAADALEMAGLRMVELAHETIEKLRPLFPAQASLRNPLDMIASANPQAYRVALEALLVDPAVASVVAIFVPPLGVRQEDIAIAIGEVAARHQNKCVVAVLMGRDGLPQGRAELHRMGVPSYIFPESAARALAALNRYREIQERPADIAPRFDVDFDRARAILRRSPRGEWLPQSDALELVACYGVPTARALRAASRDEAARAAVSLGFPVVMKVDAPSLTHKTDVGGLQFGITDGIAAGAAYDDIMSRVAAAAPDAKIDGVVVQRMITAGRETVVGVTRDDSFGPIVMFGLGGVLVEVLRDVVFRIAPMETWEAREMIHDIRGARIFDAFRGAEPVDRQALTEAIMRVAQIASDLPELLEIEINPLLASAGGVMALDARIR